MQIQFKFVYENAQDDTIRGSIENIPTDNDEILCYRSDIEGKGLVYETRDEKDGLVIMASEDHLPGGNDDRQVYPMVTNETSDPNPGEGGAGVDNDGGDDDGDGAGEDNGGENNNAEEGENPKTEE